MTKDVCLLNGRTSDLPVVASHNSLSMECTTTYILVLTLPLTELDKSKSLRIELKSSPRTDPWCAVLRSMRDAAALNKRHDPRQCHPSINLWSTYSDMSKSFSGSLSPSSPFSMLAAMIPRERKIFGKPHDTRLNLMYH